MTDLTEDERCNLGAYTDGTYSCASEDDCNGYDDNRPGHMHENLYDCVANIVATHVAAARREALLEAAESAEMLEQQRNEANDRADKAEAKVARVEALAHRARLGTVSANDITAALAEPERDEESGR